MTGGLRRALVAIAAALALADASIVALALPPILVEFDTSITGVAAIVGVYALVLALTLATRVQGAWGMAVFAAGSLGCAVAPSLTVLLIFRAVQAVGAAAALLRDSIERAREINSRAAERRSAGNGVTATPTELAILHYERRA